AEEREPGQPGPVRLPLVPVERLREPRRRDPELVDPVEAAAVDLPRLTADALLPVEVALGLVQMVVERDEVERRPDPDDRRRGMEPAEDEIEPVRGVRRYERRHRSSAIATSSSTAVSSSSSLVRSIRSRSTSRISAFGRRLTNTTKRKPNLR